MSSQVHDRRSPRGAPAALALVLALALAPAADAQTLGPDPYQPFNSMYKPFVYPTAPPSGGIPNMGRLDAIGSMASPSRGFANYLDSVGAGTSNPFGRGAGTVSRFTPYYQSYRQLDEDFGRRYSPNAQDDFYRDQADRHRRYIQALRERDPKKRQALLKDLEADNRKAVRAADDPGRFQDYRDTTAPARTNRAAAGAPDGGAGGTAAGARGARGGADARPPAADAVRLPRRPVAVTPPRNAPAEAEEPAADEPSPSRVLERSRLYSDERRPRRTLRDRMKLPEDEPLINPAGEQPLTPGGLRDDPKLAPPPRIADPALP
jgi:hypothetical protein